MKSKELKVYNLPQDEQATMVIDAKPYNLLIGFVIVGILLVLFKISNLYGVGIIIVGICSIIFLPRTVLIEFFTNYLVLYNMASKDDCCLIYYEDVVSYEYKRGSLKDYLYIELIDGSIKKIEAFSKVLFEAYLNRYFPGKQKIK